MIIWLNGTFGAGKTTTSKELAALLPDSRIFDAERVGEMLTPVLASVKVTDFQQWPPWRSLVVATATQVLDFVGGTLVVPQTVLVQEYWQEISAGLAEAGIPVRHFVLHATREELVRRIEGDGGSQWRMEHLDAYEAALPWLAGEAEILDTTDREPGRIAAMIAALFATAANID